MQPRARLPLASSWVVTTSIAIVAVTARTGLANELPTSSATTRLPRTSSSESTSPEPDTHGEARTSIVHVDGEGLELDWEPPRAAYGDREGEAPRWERMCTAPCDERLSSRGRYRLRESGHRTTSTFTIDEGRVDIHARLGSRAEQVSGIVAICHGGAVLLVGLFVYALVDSLDANSTASGHSSGATSILWTTAGISLPLVAIGVGLVVDSRNTVQINGRGVASVCVPLGAGVALTPRGLVF